MVQPHRGLSSIDTRVDRLAQRYAATPLNYRLLKRLWLIPNREHGFEHLAAALHATVPEVHRAIRALQRDGLVTERQGPAGQSVYGASSSLSAHWLITQLLEKGAEIEVNGGRPT